MLPGTLAREEVLQEIVELRKKKFSLSVASLSDPTGMPEENRRVACVECRQQKVKCTGSAAEGARCDRCTRRNIVCVVDADYKRTSKRKRILLMEQEMEDLKRQIQGTRSGEVSASASPGFSTPAALESDATEQTARSRPDMLPLPTFSSKRYEPASLIDASGSVKSWYSDPVAIDDVTLNSKTIEELFREYVLHYHPIIPVVDVSIGPAQIHSQSRALFWTIMAVASRRYKGGEMTTALSGIQKSFIADIAVSPVTRYGAKNAGTASFNLPSVYAVQAFIISSLWPLPTSSLNADSSWNTSGIAVFTAIRAGLHFPGHHKEFGRIKNSSPFYPPKLSEQCTSWLAANAVNQMVAGMYGYPSVSSFRPMMLKGMDIPASIHHSFEIQMAAHEIEYSLNSASGDMVGMSPVSERLSLIRIFSGRLDDLESTHGDNMNDYSRMELLAARVHLYSYYFFDVDQLSISQTQKGFVTAYNACLALLDHVQQAEGRHEAFMKYLPLVQVQLLWQAATIVNKLYHSRWSTNLAKRKGRDLYLKTIDCLSRASVFEHDIAFRSAEVLQQMWQVFKSMANHNERVKNATVSMNTRMAASVFFDSLWIMREECEILSHAPTVLGARTVTTSSAGPSSRKPLPKRPQIAPRTTQDSRIPPKVFPTNLQVDLEMGVARPLLSNVRGEGLVGASPSAEGQVVPLSAASVSSTSSPLPPQLETPPQDKSPESHLTPDNFEWDANTAWKDVNLMMEDFGFQLDEAGLLENFV